MVEVATPAEAPGDAAADLERLSCVSCRSRKLKCDRTKPACARCLKVNAECVYPESRRKPTFKRKNVKELEARLAQVEGMLKGLNDSAPSQGSAEDLDAADAATPDYHFNSTGEVPGKISGSTPETFFRASSGTRSRVSENEDAQLIGLGMSEALPPFEIIEKLHHIFFTNSYHMAPVVHSGRYLSAFYSDPLRRPAMCLQYAIWALASHSHPKFDIYTDVFYRRARHYIHADEMRDDGEHFITLEHAQSWVLLATYEAKRMLFTRAAMSCSRSVRICQMMGLDRLDGGVNDLPPALAPVRSWVELEERRRVFWGAFAIDCHASISTGWPYLISAEDIMTRLPASEAAFSAGEQEDTSFLHEVFEGAEYSGFAGNVVTCQIYKSILRHVHRPKPDDYPEDLNEGGFWRRHRELDNQLSSVFMFLPKKFQLPAHLQDPGAVHLNLNLHASVICLHHAALELAEKHNHPQSIIDASKTRLKTSAEEVVNIVKMTAHRTSMFRSPMCAISMYCATTVYVYMAKHDPANAISPVDLANLEIIVHAMEAIGRNHEITKALLQQACHDIDRNGLGSKVRFPALAKYRDGSRYGSASLPLFVRSSVSRHTEIMPVLPGRLPLHDPKGQRMDPPDRGTKSTVRRLIGTECYQSMMGAVTRNVGGGRYQPAVIDITEAHANKRKRTEPNAGSQDIDARSNFTQVPCAVEDIDLTDLSSWNAGLAGYGAVFSLPDRSSPSSPAYNGGGGVQTVPPSASSDSNHVSPGEGPSVVSGVGTSTIFGLGNTPAENRIDLSMFQDRAIAPMWPTEDDMFAAQIAESIATTGEIPGGISVPWNFFGGDIPPWGRS